MADTRLAKPASTALERREEPPRRRAPRDAATIRAELDRAREDIAEAFVELRDQVRETLDWRTWVKKHPAPVLVAAVAFGFWLGRR